MIATLQQVIAISDRDHQRHLVTHRCKYAVTPPADVHLLLLASE